MRLLLTTDTVGGVWTYTRELVLGLLDADASCHILLVTMGSTPTVEQSAWLQQTAATFGERFRYQTTSLPLEWQRDNADAYEAVAPVLLTAAESFVPQIFHSNQFCFGALPIACPKVVVAHSDVLSWHRAVRGADPEPSAWLAQYQTLVSAGLEGADVVVAPTSAMLHDLTQGFGALPATRVIANGRSVRAPRASKRLQAATAGRVWDGAKGISVLEDLLCPLPLLIAGETISPDATYLADRLRRRVLLGSCSERQVLELFAESAIYVVTSVYEPFGLSAVEAAQCGCAIVARDIPSQREVWADAAMYFTSGEELCTALTLLAASPHRLAAAQRAARSRAESRYARATMAANMLSLYRELMDGRSETTLADA